MTNTRDELCLAATAIGAERYVIVYRPWQRRDACEAAVRWAKDPELSFRFVNAVAMCLDINGKAAHNDLPGAC